MCDDSTSSWTVQEEGDGSHVAAGQSQRERQQLNARCEQTTLNFAFDRRWRQARRVRI